MYRGDGGGAHAAAALPAGAVRHVHELHGGRRGAVPHRHTREYRARTHTTLMSIQTHTRGRRKACLPFITSNFQKCNYCIRPKLKTTKLFTFLCLKKFLLAASISNLVWDSICLTKRNLEWRVAILYVILIIQYSCIEGFNVYYASCAKFVYISMNHRTLVRETIG